MINRKNWKLTKAYLEYREEVDQISTGSLRVETTYLRHLLEWADDISFHKADTIRPPLPEFLTDFRLDGENGKVSVAHIKKILANSRKFFAWMIANNPEYRSIKKIWISTLKPRRMGTEPREDETVTFEEILQIANAPAGNLIEKRIRAAAVFLFLSGMRIGAFVTLPLKAVDIENRVILQYPNLGVKTKNRKFGKTYLLDIPELLKVVADWDREVKVLLPENGYWFAPFSPDTKEIDISFHEVGEHRETLARRNLKSWMNKVGLPYHSPHKFRHGHIQYGLSQSKTIADYKAVSMNVMHESMDITDEIYSRLGEQEIKERIERLSEGRTKVSSDTDTYSLFQEFLEWIKNKEGTSKI